MGVCGSAPRPNPTALSLPSSGVSSLDLGRLWQRRRPFFFVYAVTFAAILRRHRFSNPQHGRRACSCHIGKQRENHMAKTNYQVRSEFCSPVFIGCGLLSDAPPLLSDRATPPTL